jgi:ATP-dependent DNA helicase RecQ
VAAQKALSCVYRTGQRFGVTYLIEVLLGKDDDRIRRNGHHQVSTFGIGQELTANEWRTLFRQLLARGYLQLDSGGHGTLQLSDTCGPLLRGEEALTLRKITKISGKDKGDKTKRKGKLDDLMPWDLELFEALRGLRTELAKEQGVPPYVIFHDSTLQGMARQRPANRDQFQFLSGVGERKLERYGEDFLAVIQRHPLPDGMDERLSDTVNESLYWRAQGLSVEQIADKRALKTSTVYGHFAAAIELGLLETQAVLNLEEGAYADILNAIELLDACEEGRTGPLFDALEGRFDHGILRCVLAETCGGH